MSNQIKFKRGLSSARTFTPAAGEPIWTTDTKRLYVGDGSTVGGVLVGSNDFLPIAGIDATKIISGTIDIARIPVLPSQKTIVSSGGIANLTTEQQNQIGEGTIVTTTDGNRWVYNGSGSKVLEASYTVLADITPEWSVIANKPSLTNTFNGRSGTVTPQSGDYTTTQVTEGSNLYFTTPRAQAAITGGATSIVTSKLTPTRALVSDAAGNVAVSWATEMDLYYLQNTTSNVQDQLNAKVDLTSSQTITGSKSFSSAIKTLYGTRSGYSAPIANTSYWVSLGTLNAYTIYNNVVFNAEISSLQSSSVNSAHGFKFNLYVAAKQYNSMASSLGNVEVIASNMVNITPSRIKVVKTNDDASLKQLTIYVQLDANASETISWNNGFCQGYTNSFDGSTAVTPIADPNPSALPEYAVTSKTCYFAGAVSVPSGGGYAITGGTSSQFLKANGTLDSTVYVSEATKTREVPLILAGATNSFPATGDFVNSNMKCLRFNGAGVTINHLYGSIDIPHDRIDGTDITFHIHHCPTDTTGGNVVWSIYWQWCENGATWGTPTLATSTVAQGTTAWSDKIATFTISGTAKTYNSRLMIHILRDPQNAADTYGADVAYIAASAHYSANLGRAG